MACGTSNDSSSIEETARKLRIQDPTSWLHYRAMSFATQTSEFGCRTLFILSAIMEEFKLPCGMKISHPACQVSKDKVSLDVMTYVDFSYCVGSPREIRTLFGARVLIDVINYGWQFNFQGNEWYRWANVPEAKRFGLEPFIREIRDCCERVVDEKVAAELYDLI